MDFDELQRTWQSQGSGPQLAIDPEMLLKEIRRNKRDFEATVFWRDVREVGAAVVMGTFFICLGITLYEWEWFLLALSMLWLVGFLVVDRMRQKRKPPVLREPLTACIESSLAQVNHQTWLLKNVLWWYLLPLGGGIGFFVGYVAWMIRKDPGKWWIFLLGYSVFGILLYWGIYHLNQWAVRKKLIPRKQELEALLNNLMSIDK